MTSTSLISRNMGLALALLLTAWSPLARAEILAPPPDDSAPPNTPPPSTPATGTRGAPAPQDNDAVIARILAGIARVGPGSATMTRSSRDLILSNLGLFARSARAVPAQEDGANGYRLSGIRARGVLSSIGLRNGDILLAINGRPTTSPQEVLAAYTGLRGASAWTLRVRRRGAETTLTVSVVPDPPAAAPAAGSTTSPRP